LSSNIDNFKTNTFAAYGQMAKIALPAMLESLLTVLIAVVDTKMIAVLGDKAISAVSLTTQPKIFVLSVFFALSAALSVFIAVVKGKNDADEAKNYLFSILKLGLAAVIRGSSVAEYVNGIWGCEFIEENGVISEIGYTIDNTTKTRALFEINKGVGKIDGMKVNTTIPEEERRVHFINMVYVADGPSDIPAFSVVKKNGGSTFAVFPKGDKKAIKQVERMRKDGRIDMMAEANFLDNGTASMWLCDNIEECANKIMEKEREEIRKYTSREVPRHLI